ncbi:MAG TPA: hypothetical protein VKT82_24370 [Ktedonobacterales bacterium]|nr:hypothetical protein [Ktedonobacterales bacterium]
MNISADKVASAAAKPQVSEDEVGPSRVMEIGLHALVTSLLIVSIIGIAYVYGFNLQTGSLLDNISAAVRALGVDGGFFLGLYFSRRLWMRRKRGWGDGIKTTLFGLIWFLVALLMASLSWFSNTLFVTNYQTIITQDLLNRAGFTDIPPQLVNKAIGAIPLVIVLLYSIVPRRMQERVDARTPEEIEAEAQREAARIRAQNMVAAARAEGAGQRIRTVLGGLAKEAFNLEERAQRDERLKQMRIALETAGIASDDLSDEQVEIQAVSRGVWDQANNRVFKIRPEKRIAMSPRLAAEQTAALGQEKAEAASVEGEADTGGSLDDTMSISELAAEFSVSPGTIKYHMKPEYTGWDKILSEEIIPLPDGSKRLKASTLMRLKRIAKAQGKEIQNSAGDAASSHNGSRSSNGRIRAVSKTPPVSANQRDTTEQQEVVENPLDYPNLSGEEIQGSN